MKSFSLEREAFIKYKLCWLNSTFYFSLQRLILQAMLSPHAALQMHCIENSKQIFTEMKLRGLVPNFYIHVSVSALHIPMIGPQTQYSKIGPIGGISTSLTDTLKLRTRPRSLISGNICFEFSEQCHVLTFTQEDSKDTANFIRIDQQSRRYLVHGKDNRKRCILPHSFWLL
jgi:hypothetical protein